MREIKFRGKSLKDTDAASKGQWVYGFFAEDQTGDIFGDIGSFGIIGTRYNGNNCFTVIDTSTVGQYTGLEDKNGVKIFDGDIVKTMYGLTPLYDPCRPKELIVGIVGVNKYNQWCLLVNGEEYHIENAMHGTVIGNIHENPELLEVSK